MIFQNVFNSELDMLNSICYQSKYIYCYECVCYACNCYKVSHAGQLQLNEFDPHKVPHTHGPETKLR